MGNTSSSRVASGSQRRPATNPKRKPKPTAATASPNPAVKPSPKKSAPRSKETYVDEDGLPLPRLPEIARRARAPQVREDAPPPTIKPVMLPPTSDTAIVNNLLARELLDSTGPVEPASPTVGVLCSLIHSISTGASLAGVKEELTQIAANQQEKAEIYNAILNQIDQERSMDSVVSRAHIEKMLKRCSLRGDMTSAELLVLYRLHNEAIKDIQARQCKTKSVDTVTIVEKVDNHSQQNEDKAGMRWENTTPQGREIIRKKLFTLRREVEGNQQAHAPSAEVMSESGTKANKQAR